MPISLFLVTLLSLCFFSLPISLVHRSIGKGVRSLGGAFSVVGLFGKPETGGNVTSLYLPTLISKPALTFTGAVSSFLETDEKVDSTSELLSLSPPLDESSSSAAIFLPSALKGLMSCSSFWSVWVPDVSIESTTSILSTVVMF